MYNITKWKIWILYSIGVIFSGLSIYLPNNLAYIGIDNDALNYIGLGISIACTLVYLLSTSNKKIDNSKEEIMRLNKYIANLDDKFSKHYRNNKKMKDLLAVIANNAPQDKVESKDMQEYKFWYSGYLAKNLLEDIKDKENGD